MSDLKKHTVFRNQLQRLCFILIVCSVSLLCRVISTLTTKEN